MILLKKVDCAVVRVDSVSQQLKERNQEMKWLLMMVLVISVSTTPYRKTVEHKFAKRIDNIVQPLVSISVKLEVITKKMENPRKIRS